MTSTAAPIIPSRPLTSLWVLHEAWQPRKVTWCVLCRQFVFPVRVYCSMASSNARARLRSALSYHIVFWTSIIKLSCVQFTFISRTYPLPRFFAESIFLHRDFFSLTSRCTQASTTHRSRRVACLLGGHSSLPSRQVEQDTTLAASRKEGSTSSGFCLEKK